MADIVLTGDTSGAITIAAPDVSGTNTLTLPASTGTLLTTTGDGSSLTGLPAAGNGPAFYAKTSTSFSVNHVTWTKVPLDTEVFDTNSDFDSTTDYRFTPTVAGYYQFNAGLFLATVSGGGYLLAILKNGSGTYYRLSTLVNSTTINQEASGSILLYANGSTDYFELFTYQTSGGTLTTGSASIDYMTGHLARTA